MVLLSSVSRVRALSRPAATRALSSRVERIADPHVHYWRPETHAWLREVLPGGAAHATPYGRFAPIAKPFTPAAHAAELHGFAPLAKSVYIQSNMHATSGAPVAETAYMQGLADACGFPSGIIAWAPLDRPDEAAAVLAQHGAFANFRGVRFMLDFDAARPELCQAAHGGYMAAAAFVAGARLLESSGLVFELQVCAAQLEEAAAFATRFPKLQVVLNHAGFPLRGEYDAWHAGLAALAAQANVACKIGGLGAYDGGFSRDEARPHVRACLALFGPARCMFASNLPVDLVDWPHPGGPSERWRGYEALALEAGLDDKQLAALFHDNAVRIYAL
jgi:predicted TIM-barrel fold metal-dependent hydrolase